MPGNMPVARKSTYSRAPLISGLSNTLRGLDPYRSGGAAVCVDTVFLPPDFHRQKIGGGVEEKGLRRFRASVQKEQAASLYFQNGNKQIHTLWE